MKVLTLVRPLLAFSSIASKPISYLSSTSGDQIMAEVRKPWGEEEKTSWFNQQKIQRSYQTDVVDKLQSFAKDDFELVQYGALSIDPEKYPTFIFVPKFFNPTLPSALITGSS